MTTAVAEQTDAAALLSEIQHERAAIEKALASMLDPLDIPGNWTERQRLHHRERGITLQQHVTALNTLAGQVTKAFATRDALRPQADRLIAAGTTIEQMIADAPDVNGIADRREQTHQWGAAEHAARLAGGHRKGSRELRRPSGVARSVARVVDGHVRDVRSCPGDVAGAARPAGREDREGRGGHRGRASDARSAACEREAVAG